MKMVINTNNLKLLTPEMQNNINFCKAKQEDLLKSARVYFVGKKKVDDKKVNRFAVLTESDDAINITVWEDGSSEMVDKITLGSEKEAQELINHYADELEYAAEDKREPVSLFELQAEYKNLEDQAITHWLDYQSE